MADTPLSVDEFRAGLADRGEDYQLLGRHGDDEVRIRFTGTFEGADILWDATLRAQGKHHPGRQFIDIAGSGHPLRRIVVGLNVDTLDRATLLKTIIMVRNYKRLHTGRHEFGKPGDRDATLL
jgi:hypothetical protein